MVYNQRGNPLRTKKMTQEEFKKKVSLLLTHKKSKWKLDVTKKELAFIALQLFMEREGYINDEFDEAITHLQEFVKDNK